MSLRGSASTEETSDVLYDTDCKMKPDPTVTFCRVCEPGCGLTVTRDEEGRPTGLRPDRSHPGTLGFACALGTQFLATATHPSRILAPLLRDESGELVAARWEAALDQVGRTLERIRKEHGPHSIGVYMGEPAGYGLMTLLATPAFVKAIGTRNAFSSAPQDCNNKFWAAREIYGHEAIHPIPDFDRCDLAVIAGMNPMVSKGSYLFLPHGMEKIRAVEKRGGRVWWIDPRRTESVRSVGRHLPIRPGTDALLLTWLVQQVAQTPGWAEAVKITPTLNPLLADLPAVSLDDLARMTDLDPKAILSLRDDLLQARSPIIHMSVGVNFGPFGSLCYVLLHALMLGLGNVDRDGGWLYHPFGLWLGRHSKLLGIGTQRAKSRIGGFEPVLDSQPGAILAGEILTPGPDRIRALIVIAGNPLWSIPGETKLREALKALDLLIVIDLFRGQTAELAHAILPGRTWLERADFSTLGTVIQNRTWLSYSAPVLEPLGESKSEWEILFRILSAMHVGGPFRRLLHGALARWDHDRWLVRAQALLRRLFDRHGQGKGRAIPVAGPSAQGNASRASLHPDHTLHLCTPNILAETKRFVAWFSQIRSETPSLHGEDGWIPVSLIGRRRSLMYNSWHGLDGPGGGDGTALVHPATAARIGLATGQLLELRSNGGETLKMSWEASDGLPESVVSVPHGLTTINVNRLLPSGAEWVEPLSGQHIMTGIPASARRA